MIFEKNCHKTVKYAINEILLKINFSKSIRTSKVMVIKIGKFHHTSTTVMYKFVEFQKNVSSFKQIIIGLYEMFIKSTFAVFSH